MADVFFENPPLQGGTEEQQLSVLYGHLAIMADKLNTALHNITAEQLVPEAQSVLQQIPQQKEEREKVRKDLKKLIIKNAEIVETAMEEIRTHLQGQITAISEDFGEFTQSLDAEIVATAEGVLQSYNVMQRIQSAEDATQSFINRISQYIFTGLLDSGEVGIAIGTNVTDTVTGELIPANKMATFTSSELAFYQNGEKVYSMNIVANSIEFAESKNAAASGDGSGQGYIQTPPPSQNEAPDDGFMNMPEEMDESLPFN